MDLTQVPFDQVMVNVHQRIGSTLGLPEVEVGLLGKSDRKSPNFMPNSSINHQS